MPNLTPTSSFDSVPELETSTLALGGPGGPMNLPLQALLNRTEWLRDNAAAGSSSPHATAAGTANAITATYTPAIAATANGLKLRFTAATANTGATTFAPDAITASAILGQAGLPLQGGELAANSEVELTWSSAAGAWVMTACTDGLLQVDDGAASHHAVSKGQLDAVSAVASAAVPSADLASTAVGKGAELSGFTQAGTGAVTTDLGARGRKQFFTTDFDTLAHAKAAAGTGQLYDPVQGKTWMLGGKSPTFDEAAGVLGRLIAFDNQGVSPTLGANQQFYGIRSSQTDGSANAFTVGAAGIVATMGYYMKSLAGSDATSNMYGAIGNVENAGPGTVKALYGRGVVDAGCTGVAMGLVGGVSTNASATPSHTTVLQLAPDTVPGTSVDEIIWASSNQATGFATHGILFDSKISISGAVLKAFAVGAGDFLDLKNAAGSADLFRVTSTGAVVGAADINGLTLTAASASNGVQISQGAVTRTAASGNLSVLCGASGTLSLGTTSATPLQITGSIVSIQNGSGSRLNFTGAGATTVGAAGTAAALPAQPLGYILVRVNGGGDVKIPYYNN